MLPSPPPGSLPSRRTPRARVCTAAGALAAAVATALGGCAQDPAAAPAASTGKATLPPASALPLAAPPPAGTPQARLLARASAPPDRRLLLVQLTDTAACKGPQLLGQGNAAQPPQAVALAAGQWLTLDVVLQDTAARTACTTRMSFTPQVGRTYLAQAVVNAQGCPAMVLDVTVPDRAVPPPDLLLRTAPGQNCLPLARSARVADLGLRGGQHRGDAVLRPNATTRGLEGLIAP